MSVGHASFGSRDLFAFANPLTIALTIVFRRASGEIPTEFAPLRDRKPRPPWVFFGPEQFGPAFNLCVFQGYLL